jgi:hypothetical protein
MQEVEQLWRLEDEYEPLEGRSAGVDVPGEVA